MNEVRFSIEARRQLINRIQKITGIFPDFRDESPTVIDIDDFASRLAKQHPDLINYYSIEDFINQKFGSEVNGLIQKLL